MELDVAQLHEERASNVSYDLRIGKKYRDHREAEPREISEHGVITLYPGSALIIQTEEYVHLPRRLFGTIAPKVKLLENGLSTTFSKVDPGYYGHLLITLFNLETVRTLRRGDKFCALTLFKVAPGARLYEKGPPTACRAAGPTKPPRTGGGLPRLGDYSACRCHPFARGGHTVRCLVSHAPVRVGAGTENERARS